MKKTLQPQKRILTLNTAKTYWLIYLFIFSFISSRAQNNDINVPDGQLRLISTASINSLRTFSPNTVNANALYSNVTTFAGSGLKNGGAENQAGNTITRLVADSLGFINTPPYSISSFTFSVINFDASNVTARPRVRFFANDGPGGSPGTVITGFSFNPISFSASTIQTFSATATFTVTTPAIWAGITFDDNTGTTGATLAQLNNLGQGIFNPIDRGTSTDTYFLTTAAGSFLSNSPAGSEGNFGGAPLANFGWEIVSSIPLPISLNGFTAQRNGSINNLTWSTSQEFNTSSFVIERSTDGGRTFTQIGQVAAAGNSSTLRNYQFTDALPTKGINYYRLRIVDKDNNAKYSDVRSVRNIGNADFVIYPNPVKDVMKVDISADRADKGVITITDVSGKQVYNQKVNVGAGNNTFNIDVNNMAQGAYIIKVQLSDDAVVKKFTKM